MRHRTQLLLLVYTDIYALLPNICAAISCVCWATQELNVNRHKCVQLNYYSDNVLTPKRMRERRSPGSGQCAFSARARSRTNVDVFADAQTRCHTMHARARAVVERRQCVRAHHRSVEQQLHAAATNVAATDRETIPIALWWGCSTRVFRFANAKIPPHTMRPGRGRARERACVCAQHTHKHSCG